MLISEYMKKNNILSKPPPLSCKLLINKTIDKTNEIVEDTWAHLDSTGIYLEIITYKKENIQDTSTHIVYHWNSFTIFQIRYANSTARIPKIYFDFEIDEILYQQVQASKSIDQITLYHLIDKEYKSLLYTAIMHCIIDDNPDRIFREDLGIKIIQE